MSDIQLRDILISARQESYRMQHYYIGVEHIFIALLGVRGGMARTALEEQGLAPDYVVDALRHKIGKGSKRRLWPGTPSSPRATVILDVATDIAIEDGRSQEQINERDLLTAILNEGDNLPVHVLERLGIDLNRLLSSQSDYHAVDNYSQSHVHIEFAPGFDTELDDDQRIIIRRMFRDAARVRIKSRLTGGYSDALVLIVTPIQADGRRDAAVVVKLDRAEIILDEAQRYESHVKRILPPLTARLEEKPVAPEFSDLAGLQYTIVSRPGKPPQDLRQTAHEMGPDKLGFWLRQQLYNNFGRTWWQQRDRFRFPAWTEYDWSLPPILTIHADNELNADETAHTLRIPVNMSRLRHIECGDHVVLENFSVLRIDPSGTLIHIANGRGSEAARRAFRIKVLGIDPSTSVHYRGEVIERLVGRVWKTRQEHLSDAVSLLAAPFSVDTAQFSGPGGRTLPNPVFHHNNLLELTINGATSKIHGDLHLGNILVGPNDSAFLIDFAHTRDGHTCFDWATLEISLLTEVVAPMAGEGWNAVYTAFDYLTALNEQTALPRTNPQVALAISPLIALRDIVNESLADPSDWTEYYLALALAGLRAVTWENRSLGGRRLAFLTAALAIDELRRRHHRKSVSQTSEEITDMTEY